MESKRGPDLTDPVSTASPGGSPGSSPDKASLAHIELPLRGLAGEGAGPRVTSALLAVPGVTGALVRGADFSVRVAYDPARVTSVAIREALHGVGTRAGARSHAGPSGDTPPPTAAASRQDE